FSCLGVLRRTIAWSVNTEYDWPHYGLNRYLSCVRIATPTFGNRYAPSIRRCDINGMKSIYRQYALEREGKDVSEVYKQYLESIDYFEIIKTFDNRKICFGILKNISRESEE